MSGLPFSEHGSCLRLPPRDNASIIKLHNKTNSGTNVFPEGTHVSFFCVHRNDGVRRDDDGKLICRNGSWHGSSPRCSEYRQTCNGYDRISNLQSKVPPEITISIQNFTYILGMVSKIWYQETDISSVLFFCPKKVLIRMFREIGGSYPCLPSLLYACCMIRGQ